MSSPLSFLAAPSASQIRYELRFQSLFDAGRSLCFPCDAQGRVDETHLSEQARRNYRRARQVIGKDWASPSVQVSFERT